MTRRRALIIAIETYASMNDGLVATLAGTHQAATTFRDWLVNQQGLAPADIYFCAEDASLPGRTAGATRKEIVREIGRLHSEGKDRTDELYVLYIGHGLCYRDVDGGRLADILLAADYETRALSGNECLKIDEIQQWLRMCMGPSDHFYFIDACRNDVDEREIKVGSMGLAYDPSFLGTPTVYTLYSVTAGNVAAADSGFVRVLVDALSGLGRAKVWRSGGGMAVFFRSAKDYVERKLTGQQIDQRIDGSREGLIREIKPTPKFTCKIVVENATSADRFVVTATDSREVAGPPQSFFGPAASIERVPDDYVLSVSTPGAVVEPVDPPPADLYEDCTIRFIKRTPAAADATDDQEAVAAGAVPELAQSVSVRAADDIEVRFRHLQTGDATVGRGDFSERLPTGRYSMKTIDAARNVILKEETVEVGGETPVELDVHALERSPLRDALLASIPASHHAGVDFSETLGPMADQGMDLWLALIGASRITGDPHDFSKLGGLPLATFDAIEPGQCALYLLVGVEPAPTEVVFALSSGATADLRPIDPHPTLAGLFEHREARPPGYAIASVGLDGRVPTSVGVTLLPDRVTLLTVTADGGSGLRLQQYLLPVRHLLDRLPVEVQRFYGDTPLRGVRRIVEVQRRFARSQELDRVFSDEQLQELLHLQWFEPVIALLACYELIRRGRRDLLRDSLANLRGHFEGIPDAEAIAKLAGLDWRMPPHPPLVLEGLLALNMPTDSLPLDGTKLDYRGPWTAWSGAVVAAERNRGAPMAAGA